jgi:hypothetical protein
LHCECSPALLFFVYIAAATTANDDTRSPTNLPTFLPTANIVAPTIAPTIAPTLSPTADCSAFTFGGTSSSIGCSPNLLVTARQDPTLSLIVSLFELAGLASIFDCPGPISAALPTNSTYGLFLLSLRLINIQLYLTIFCRRFQQAP